jgi:hypothetical protein
VRPADLVARYEQLRHIAVGGHAGGWRHGLGVLVAKGMACWMAACAALPAAAPEHGGPPAAATPQAGASLSALNPSLPAPDQEGGASSPACTPLLPAAVVPQIVAVLAQMTLAHARTTPSSGQEAHPP